MTIQKPRGKSAELYANEHAAVKGELDALRYAHAVQAALLADILSELSRFVEKAQRLLAERPGQERQKRHAEQP